ncbi:hypothetical protein BpHYR1_019396 [Brachionus plicatilis]|uniref:Uncharacterized protein n=1 Tax=Brachionus plicatilis TaxID=10195 RepID=A0A3M7PGC1_BRAPC|nr:hypothetical protein BpHYR1_019396 [Brachionus plicatilis]
MKNRKPEKMLNKNIRVFFIQRNGTPSEWYSEGKKRNTGSIQWVSEDLFMQIRLNASHFNENLGIQ